MSLRLVITMHAAPGRGAELAALQAERCREVQQEPGCEDFEIFQSALDPDRLLLLERWADEDALAVHAERNRARPPMDPSLRSDVPGEREDYTYNRTR